MKKRMYRFLMTGVMAAAMLGMTACGSKTGTGDTAAAAAAADSSAAGETASGEDIGFPKKETITLVVQMDDEQGLLSDLLHVVAVYRANILTIHQSIPVNGVATLTLSVEVRENTGNVSSMIEELEVLDGIHYVKILARE